MKRARGGAVGADEILHNGTCVMSYLPAQSDAQREEDRQANIDLWRLPWSRGVCQEPGCDTGAEGSTGRCTLPTFYLNRVIYKIVKVCIKNLEDLSVEFLGS